MELDGCFPRGVSQTIPMSVMVPLIVPPLHHPTPNQAGTQGPFLHSFVQWVGRSWGPALALARLQGFCQQGGIGPHCFSQWVALGQAFLFLHVPPPVRKKTKETILGQANCALYIFSCTQCSWHKAAESQGSVASEFPPFSQVSRGPEALGIYFLLSKVGLVLRVRQRAFGDLRL